MVGDPLITGDRVLDITVFVALDSNRPVGHERSHEAHSDLLHHPQGSGVDHHRLGLHAFDPEPLETAVDQRLRSFRRQALAPGCPMQSIAQLRLEWSVNRARSAPWR